MSADDVARGSVRTVLVIGTCPDLRASLAASVGGRAGVACAEPLEALEAMGRAGRDLGALVIDARHCGTDRDGSEVGTVVDLVRSHPRAREAPIIVVGDDAAARDLAASIGSAAVGPREAVGKVVELVSGPAQARNGARRGDAAVVEALAPWERRFRLTRAELTVVERIVCGRSNKEASRDLGVSLATVRTHLMHACQKLGVNTRTELCYRVLCEVQARQRDGQAACARPTHARSRHRIRVLVLCEHRCVREFVVEALEDARVFQALSVDEPAALAVLGASEDLRAVIVEPRSVETRRILAGLHARSRPPRVIEIGTGREEAAPDAGVDRLTFPFRKGDLVRLLVSERRLEDESRRKTAAGRPEARRRTDPL